METKQKNGIILLLLALAIVSGVIIFSGNMVSPEILVWFVFLAVVIIAVTVLKRQTSDKSRWIIAVAALILILVSIAGQLAGAGPVDPVFLTALFTCGFVLLVWAWRLGRDGNQDRLIQDERSQKIGTYGISYSWYLTYLVAAMLGWLTAMGEISLDITTFSLLIIILMPVSAFFFQWYFNRQGDVF